MGLPVAVVQGLKSHKEAASLLNYDKLTQPPLEPCSWNNFMDYLESGRLEGQQQSLAISALKIMDIYGNSERSDRHNPNLPIFRLKSTGEPFDSIFMRDTDTDDISIDVGAIDEYLRHGRVTFFRGIGKGTEAALTEFVNSKIEELPSA